MQSNVERWMPVVGYEGLYEVSNWGRVKSLARTATRSSGTHPRSLKELILKPVASTDGYLRVGLCRNGTKSTWYVHVLVAAAFLGPRPDGLIVLHGSKGPLDNRPENLSYGTYADNNGRDRLRDGTQLRGERHGRAKLTAEQVMEARRLVAAGPRGTQNQLARKWGVTNVALSKAVRGISWGRVTTPEPCKPCGQ